MKTVEPGWVFDRTGDHLALDFANTVSSRHTGAPIERLPDYGQLVAFAAQCGLIDADEAARLVRWAERHKRDAEELIADVRGLREAVYGVFAALAEEHTPGPDDLAVLNHWIAKMRLGPGLDWEWAEGERAPCAPLLGIVRACLDLVRSGERERVRVCAADDCLWLFLDSSKNRSRRWCDMKQCGNRMKARRFHAKKSSTDLADAHDGHRDA